VRVAQTSRSFHAFVIWCSRMKVSLNMKRVAHNADISWQSIISGAPYFLF